MRKENEILTQLLNFANSEEKVRAVLLNGSRVNPNVKKDLFCDYDVAFSVTDPEYYLKNQGWIKRFGELVIMQQNDMIIGSWTAYYFLMQFKDGVRIDLSFHPVEHIAETLAMDSLTRVILDKDNIVGPIEPANDSSHFIKEPSKGEFEKLLNEAWWIQTYVAKGIWRDEFPLVRYMHDAILQQCVTKLLSWYVAMRHDWKINVGKCGKWLKKFLPENIYKEYLETCSTKDYKEIWDALFNAGKLIRRIGTEVAGNLGYVYPMEYDINVTEYIKKIRLLPKDAEEF